jgi:hypothetical protein
MKTFELDCESFLDIRNSSTEEKSVYLSIYLVLRRILNCVSIRKTFNIRRQMVGNFDASIGCTFLRTWEAGSWSVKKVHVSCVDTVYSWICLKVFLVIYTENSLMKICIHMEGHAVA